MRTDYPVTTDTQIIIKDMTAADAIRTCFKQDANARRMVEARGLVGALHDFGTFEVKLCLTVAMPMSVAAKVLKDVLAEEQEDGAG